MAAATPCPHKPRCPSAEGSDRGAARVVACFPEQGWNLLCNGILLFEDTGASVSEGNLFHAYVKAFEVYLTHRDTCVVCENSRLPCAVSALLHDRFVSLQELYAAGPSALSRRLAPIRP